jgi:hypothetical protein
MILPLPPMAPFSASNVYCAFVAVLLLGLYLMHLLTVRRQGVSPSTRYVFRRARSGTLGFAEPGLTYI